MAKDLVQPDIWIVTFHFQLKRTTTLLAQIQQQQPFQILQYLEHDSLCSAWLLISTSLCSVTDVPPPTDGSVSVVALNEAGKVTVTWNRPTLGPGQVVTGYSVQYRRRGTPSYTNRTVSGSSTTSYTIANLNLGTVYEVRVASVGPLGLSGYCCGSGKQVTTYNGECTVYGKDLCPYLSLSQVALEFQCTFHCLFL